MIRTLAAAGLVLALAACSGGSSDGTSFGAPFDIAAELGCQKTFDEESGAIAPADVGTCKYGGEQVTLVVGTDEEIEATERFAAQLNKQFGVSVEDGTVVEGDGWAVMTESHSVAAAVQGDIGGDL